MFPRRLPESATGFVRCTGIPNTPTSKPYFASVSEALDRCRKDPTCVGISDQRIFYGPFGTPTLHTGGVSLLKSSATLTPQ
jgi:hypothetical protein